MIMRPLTIALICLLAATAGAQTNNPAPIPIELFKGGPLFNGRNLDGLQVYLEDPAVDPAKIWKVEDGILRCSGATRGYVRTRMAYADYKLTVEWRWPGGKGNSGILLHIINQDQVWPKCIEAQLATGRAGDLAFFHDSRSKEELVSRNPKGLSTGRLARPGESAEKPLGEWNTFEITAAGDTLTLTVNGVKVNHITGVVPAAGMIALQSEGAPIDFRNFTLTPLPLAKDINAPMPK